MTVFIGVITVNNTVTLLFQNNQLVLLSFIIEVNFNVCPRLNCRSEVYLVNTESDVVSISCTLLPCSDIRCACSLFNSESSFLAEWINIHLVEPLVTVLDSIVDSDICLTKECLRDKDITCLACKCCCNIAAIISCYRTSCRVCKLRCSCLLKVCILSEWNVLWSFGCALKN